MDSKKVSIKDMLVAMEQELGESPVNMEYISKLDEELLHEHASNKNFAMSGDGVAPKYKLLISLAVSLALGDINCVNTYVKVALRKGITPKEIMETIKTVRFVKGTTVISSATEAMKIMLDNVD